MSVINREKGKLLAVLLKALFWCEGITVLRHSQLTGTFYIVIILTRLD